MDVESDRKISEETKLLEDLEGKSSTNTKLSEENQKVSEENSMKGKHIKESYQTSEESKESENESKTNSNNSYSADINELLMESNCLDRKKTSENVRSRQENPKVKKQNRKDLKVSKMTQSKSVITQTKVTKGNICPKKKICPTERGKRVHFQKKNKKPDEMKNSNTNESREVKSLSNQLCNQGIADSLAPSNGSPSNIESASSNVQSKHLLDYGFTHMKEEMRILIQQCVDKEDTIESLEKRLKETNESYTDTKKKCLHLEQKNEKLSKNLEAATKKLDKTTQDLNSANTFISEAKKAKKIADSVMSDLEKRLEQTLALNEKLKAKLDTMNLDGKNDQLLSQNRIQELTETNKLLSRQKSELREVVIKQMQLVNNLKRQLLHLKAGIAQKFTEQEVGKVIDEFY